jgi:hypothetical protein
MKHTWIFIVHNSIQAFFYLNLYFCCLLIVRVEVIVAHNHTQ